MERKKRETYSRANDKIINMVKSKKYGVDEKTAITFATRFNDLLAENKIDQEDFAEDIGMSSGVVSYYRSGERIPTILTLKNIAEKLHTTTDYLLGLTDSKSVDENYQKVHNLTGLSDEAIRVLKRELNLHKEAMTVNEGNTIFIDGLNTISYLIENEEKYGLFKNLSNYLWFDINHKELVEQKAKVTNDDYNYTYTLDMVTNLAKISIDNALFEIKKEIEQKAKLELEKKIKEELRDKKKKEK